MKISFKILIIFFSIIIFGIILHVFPVKETNKSRDSEINLLWNTCLEIKESIANNNKRFDQWHDSVAVFMQKHKFK